MSHLVKKIIESRTVNGLVRRHYWVNPEANILQSAEANHNLHISRDQGHKVETAKVPPRDRAEVSYGLLFSKRANEGVDHALEAIAKVHDIPANLKRVPIKVKGYLGGAEGRYLVYNPWGANEIHVSKWSEAPAGAVVHEYGHFLDHHLLGSGEQGLHGLGTMKRNPDMKDLMVTLNRSKAVKSLVERHKQNQANNDWAHTNASTYLLMQPEIFARAYEQYIGIRSGSKTIQDNVEHMRASWAQHGYQAQWEPKDFEPIAREFDRMFQKRGLLRSRRGT